MLLSSMVSDPVFADFILGTIPDIARLPAVQAAIERYTSGYLNKTRLTAVMNAVSYPLVELGPVDPPASAWCQHNTIRVGTSYFQFYKNLIGNYPISMPVSFFHELAHWGCWMRQQEGHSLDRYGREHDYHGDFKSPLNTELERVLRAQRFFVPAPTRPTRAA